MAARNIVSPVLFGLLLSLGMGQGCPGTSNAPSELVSGSTPTGGTTTGATTGGSTSGTGTGGTAATSIVDVSIDNYAFTPKSITIQAGQAVRWTNHEFVTHSVSSGNPGDADAGSLFNSGGLGIGRTYQYTFTTPGTYAYHDPYYSSRPAMRDATVTVTGTAN